MPTDAISMSCAFSASHKYDKGLLRDIRVYKQLKVSLFPPTALNWPERICYTCIGRYSGYMPLVWRFCATALTDIPTRSERCTGRCITRRRGGPPARLPFSMFRSCWCYLVQNKTKKSHARASLITLLIDQSWWYPLPPLYTLTMYLVINFTV